MYSIAFLNVERARSTTTASGNEKKSFTADSTLQFGLECSGVVNFRSNRIVEGCAFRCFGATPRGNVINVFEVQVGAFHLRSFIRVSCFGRGCEMQEAKHIHLECCAALRPCHLEHRKPIPNHSSSVHKYTCTYKILFPP